MFELLINVALLFFVLIMVGVVDKSFKDLEREIDAIRAVKTEFTNNNHLFATNAGEL